MLVYTQAGVTALLADAVAGVLDGCKLKLFQNDFHPSAFSVAADFTIADYTGYGDKTIAAADWNPIIQPDGSAGIVGPGEFFDATGTATPNTIYGYYVTDSAGTSVLWAERFDAPVGITGPGTGFTMVPQLNGISQAG